MPGVSKREVLAWASYDFANSERKAELSETPALNAVLEMMIKITADAKVPGPV